MSFRVGFFLLSFSTILLGGFLVWKQWYALGKIVFIAPAPFSIAIEGQEKKICTHDRCTLSLFPKKHSFQADKEGFQPLFGNIEIKYQKKNEIILAFSPISVFENVSAEKMTQRILPKWQKSTSLYRDNEKSTEEFDEKQKIPAEIEEKNNFWTWQNIPLSSNKNRIASDEVGRGFWIFSDDEILFFSTSTKQKTLIFSGKIVQFLPLSSGDLIAEDTQKNIWWISDNTIRKIDFPFRFSSSICSPALGKFLGIAAKEGFPYSTTLFEWDFFSQQAIQKGDIEGFSSEKFAYSFCSRTEYGMIMKDKSAQILQW